MILGRVHAHCLELTAYKITQVAFDAFLICQAIHPLLENKLLELSPTYTNHSASPNSPFQLGCRRRVRNSHLTRSGFQHAFIVAHLGTQWIPAYTASFPR
jgi:hypothetical protein